MDIQAVHHLIYDALPENLALFMTSELRESEKDLKEECDLAFNILDLSELDITEINWDRYDAAISTISNILESYEGKFKSYFLQKLDRLKDREQIILGYYHTVI